MKQEVRNRAGWIGVAALCMGGLAFMIPSWATEQAPQSVNSGTASDTEDEMVDEYQEALGDPTLRFPAGVSLPDAPAEAGGGSTGGRKTSEDEARYSEGYGEMEAADVWRCAWEYEMATAFAESNATGVQEAANELQGFYNIPAVQKYVIDPNHYWYKDTIKPALDGDASALNQDLELNCSPEIGQ